MPRSPTQPTVASFLKPNPGISPPGKKGKGKKRKLSSSPNSNNVFSSKKLNDAASPKVALSTFDSDFPPLPQTPPLPDASVMATPALSPSPHPPQQPCLPENPLSNKNLYNPKDLNSTTISHSLSSMDDSLLEMDQEDAPILDSFPTSDEADDLLRDDAPGNLPPSESVDSPPSSPTAAVKFAIEAQIAENLVTLSSKPICVESNKDAINDSTPLPLFWPPLLLKNPSHFFLRVFRLIVSAMGLSQLLPPLLVGTLGATLPTREKLSLTSPRAILTFSLPLRQLTLLKLNLLRKLRLFYRIFFTFTLLLFPKHHCRSMTGRGLIRFSSKNWPS